MLLGGGLLLLWYPPRISGTLILRMTKLIVQGLNYEFLKTLSLRLYKIFVNILNLQ